MKKFKWVLELTVDETWVTDGFNPSADQFKDAILESMLGYAYPNEVKVKVLNKPNLRQVAKSQGFKTVKQMKDADNET